MSRILIEVEYGIVQEVYCDDDHSVMVIDYDVENGSANLLSSRKDEENELCYVEHYFSPKNDHLCENWSMLEREEEP